MSAEMLCARQRMGSELQAGPPGRSRWNHTNFPSPPHTPTRARAGAPLCSLSQARSWPALKSLLLTARSRLCESTISSPTTTIHASPLVTGVEPAPTVLELRGTSEILKQSMVGSVRVYLSNQGRGWVAEYGIWRRDTALTAVLHLFKLDLASGFPSQAEAFVIRWHQSSLFFLASGLRAVSRCCLHSAAMCSRSESTVGW